MFSTRLLHYSSIYKTLVSNTLIMQVRGSRVTWSVKGGHLVGSLTRGGTGEHIKDASALVTDHAVHQGGPSSGVIDHGGDR